MGPGIVTIHSDPILPAKPPYSECFQGQHLCSLHHIVVSRPTHRWQKPKPSWKEGHCEPYPVSYDCFDLAWVGLGSCIKLLLGGFGCAGLAMFCIEYQAAPPIVMMMPVVRISVIFCGNNTNDSSTVSDILTLPAIVMAREWG